MKNEFINLSKQLLSHPLHDDFLDLHLYTILIKFNLENQSAHDAFQLVKEMKEKAIYPDKTLLQTITDGLIKSNLVMEAYEFIQECTDQGYHISLIIYRTLLQGLLEVNDIDKVEKIYNHIRANGKQVVPTVLYNLVLQAAANHIKVDFFQKVWKDLSSASASTLHSDRGIKKESKKLTTSISPNMISHEIAVSFYIKIRNLDLAIHQLSLLLEKTLPPPHSTFRNEKVSNFASDVLLLSIQSMQYRKSGDVISLVSRYSISLENVIKGPNGKRYVQQFRNLVVQIWEQCEKKMIRKECDGGGGGDEYVEFRTMSDTEKQDLQRECHVILDVYNHIIQPSKEIYKNDGVEVDDENVYQSMMGSYLILGDLVGIVRTWTTLEKASKKQERKILAKSLELLVRGVLILGSLKTARAVISMVTESMNGSPKENISGGNGGRSGKEGVYEVSNYVLEMMVGLGIKYTDARIVPLLLLELESRLWNGTERIGFDERIGRMIRCSFLERKEGIDGMYESKEKRVKLEEFWDAKVYLDGFLEECFPELVVD